jgi:hypothetical protein
MMVLFDSNNDAVVAYFNVLSLHYLEILTKLEGLRTWPGFEPGRFRV